MKGILLCGGSSTRLYPSSIAVNKHLFQVYSKPMCYYSLTTIMLSGIKDVLIISNRKDISSYQMLFGDGKHLGMRIYYAVQETPNGIVEAFIIGEQFIGNDAVCLSLGDNVIYGQDLSNRLKNATKQVDFNGGATIFGYRVKDPERYGIVEVSDGKVVSIEEKPKEPKSDIAIIGLYFYDNKVVNIAKNLKPSNRGELEISDVNNEYLKIGKLNLEVLGRGNVWLDCGTFDSLLDASNFVATIEHRQGTKIGCIEEIAYRMKFIDEKQLRKLAEEYKNNEYKEYLLSLLVET